MFRFKELLVVNRERMEIKIKEIGKKEKAGNRLETDWSQQREHYIRIGLERNGFCSMLLLQL